VNPVLMMAGYASAKKPAQMAFIDRNDLIEKLAAATTYPPFEPILPRRLDPHPLYFQPRRFQEIRNSSIKLRVVVENDITAARGVRESLAELLQDPLSGGVTGHVECRILRRPWWMTNRQ